MLCCKWNADFCPHLLFSVVRPESNCKKGNQYQYPHLWQCTETYKVTTIWLPLTLTLLINHCCFPPLKYLLCPSDFQVYVNSTGSTKEEGEAITLTCVHNFTNMDVTFGWKKGRKGIHEGRNESELVLKKVLVPDSGQYICFVDSPCGRYESLPHDVTVNSCK